SRASDGGHGDRPQGAGARRPPGRGADHDRLKLWSCPATACEGPTHYRSTSLEGRRMTEPERVTVLGLGDFGYHLACELYQLGHEVLAVDSDQDKVQQILPYVTKAAVADASDRAALQELDIASFDLVAVCVGERLETAVLLVHFLHLLQVPRILVKVKNEEQGEIVKLVGATEGMHPGQNSASKTAVLMPHPRAVDFKEHVRWDTGVS